MLHICFACCMTENIWKVVISLFTWSTTHGIAHDNQWVYPWHSYSCTISKALVVSQLGEAEGKPECGYVGLSAFDCHIVLALPYHHNIAILTLSTILISTTV